LSKVAADVFTGSRQQQVLTVQVLLDRAHFSPGAIDGRAGSNTANAIRAFERAQRLRPDGRIDPQLLRRLSAASPGAVLLRYTISEEDINGPFIDRIPDELTEMSKLDRLTFAGPLELLAERFHMSEGLLQSLNPGADFGKVGTQIVVVAGRTGRLAGEVARIDVDKRTRAVRAYDRSGKLLAFYPASVGSAKLPSPTGSMAVRAIAPDPAYFFDPDKMAWGPDRDLKIAPGPNNPVGSTWIDLTKEGYGIHGTPEPAQIGKAASHGCVRLTNWDAEELAAAVRPGAKVLFITR
jgi:lipoprotein-anchoring transpeptidase ErfK/SrfK